MFDKERGGGSAARGKAHGCGPERRQWSSVVVSERSERSERRTRGGRTHGVTRVVSVAKLQWDKSFRERYFPRMQPCSVGVLVRTFARRG